ncbi:MAG: DNA mismatch repair endonuclease MutL [Clostridia bacterium]|nr:DNA mismatch repair endonuclease MutL [Clostridia bacterium]
MPKINLLSKQVSELIAAGEVVERPASVLKELIENSIDAGATIITVEIKNGGISYMRITDNGCGISEEDVPLAFMRHATSKITNSDDLNSISTLGFRGEALAAISSVSRVKLLTKTADSDLGTLFEIEGGEQMEYSPTGCPNGTTIIISDLFYNTPARMKFLKKDVSEANACANVIDRIALSHTEISFKFIRDGKQVLSTNGDKNLRNAVYSILGREFSSNLIDVNSTTNTISVSGLICKPFACKATRNNQYTFLNGRLVRSGTVIAAVEQAYKNSAMIGKFPSFVLYLTVPFDTVDVNVHPAKTEVRFSDEKVVFEAVYAAVKNSLSSGDTRPEIKTPQATFNQFERLSVPQFKQAVFESAPAETTKPKVSKTNLVFETPEKPEFTKSTLFVDINPEPKATNYQASQTIKVDNSEPIVPILEPEKEEVIIIGEAFNTYIVAQMGESVFLIDKHAAHERILFENLKKLHKIEVQVLLTPIMVTLNKNEYNTIIENADILQQCGFEVEDFGINSLAVRAVPTTLVDEDLSLILSEIAESLIKSGKVQIELEDNLFHTVACKAAIKAGSKLSLLEMQNLAEKVLRSKEIMYCPHGRPVAFEIKKRELEKMFGRIQ